MLLFTGKGGVGKTTAAAATALRCADAGLRTLVLSTDPAHSLADALDVELGPLVAPVADGLWGQQLDAQDRMEDSWAEIQRYLVEVFRWAGIDTLEAEELSVVPGLDEVFALADIREHADADWDVVVVDCAPTAETIRLLSLPDVLARYMERVFPDGRQVNRVVSPVMSRLTTLPVADDDLFAATRRFYDRLAGVREILTDGTRTSVRLVVNPERLVIAEARRTHTYLALFGYHVDAVIREPDPAGRRRRPVVRPLEGAARPAPVGHRRGLRPGAGAEAPAAAGGTGGPRGVAHGGRRPLRRRGPDGAVRSKRAHARRRRGAATVLEVDLPFTERDELELGRRNGELLVRVGPYRRRAASRLAQPPIGGGSAPARGPAPGDLRRR